MIHARKATWGFPVTYSRGIYKNSLLSVMLYVSANSAGLVRKKKKKKNQVLARVSKAYRTARAEALYTLVVTLPLFDLLRCVKCCQDPGRLKPRMREVEEKYNRLPPYREEAVKKTTQNCIIAQCNPVEIPE